MNSSNKPIDIGCLEAIETLYAWLDNELEDGEMTSSFEHHLSHCKSCWSRVEMEKALTEHIKRSVGAETDGDSSTRSPDSLQSRLEKLMNEF